MTAAMTFDMSTTADDVTTAYRAADVSGKAAMKAAVKAAMKAAAIAGDGDLALHLIGIESAMTAAPKERAVVDYAQVVADHIATLEFALAAARSGDLTMPEGVAVPDAEAVAQRTGTPDMKRAATMLTVSGRKAGRGSVAGYVESVLGDDPMKIADLRAAWSPSADYPKAPPSAGAIGAMFDRIENGSDELAIEVVTVNGSRGCRWA